MKIALLGYGRMGKEIEKISLQRGHEIVLKVSSNETFDIGLADVAIDFSVPTSAYNNIETCLKNNIPVISGTTGWLDNYEKAVDLCTKKRGAFIYASNFSLGVNMFFELNKQLAKMMNRLSDYHITMEETHHTKKLDAPSGTAITLAEGIIANSSKSAWTLNGAISDESIPITAKRIEDVPGTHSVHYSSEVDAIAIEHIAHNRKGFALGAVVAAEWILNKEGVFTMQDVLNIG